MRGDSSRLILPHLLKAEKNQKKKKGTLRNEDKGMISVIRLFFVLLCIYICTYLSMQELF